MFKPKPPPGRPTPATSKFASNMAGFGEAMMNTTSAETTVSINSADALAFCLHCGDDQHKTDAHPWPPRASSQAEQDQQNQASQAELQEQKAAGARVALKWMLSELAQNGGSMEAGMLLQHFGRAEPELRRRALPTAGATKWLEKQPQLRVERGQDGKVVVFPTQGPKPSRGGLTPLQNSQLKAKAKAKAKRAPKVTLTDPSAAGRGGGRGGARRGRARGGGGGGGGGRGGGRRRGRGGGFGSVFSYDSRYN